MLLTEFENNALLNGDYVDFVVGKELYRIYMEILYSVPPDRQFQLVPMAKIEYVRAVRIRLDWGNVYHRLDVTTSELDITEEDRQRLFRNVFYILSADFTKGLDAI